MPTDGDRVAVMSVSWYVFGRNNKFAISATRMRGQIRRTTALLRRCPGVVCRLKGVEWGEPSSQSCHLLNRFAQLARQDQCAGHRVFVFSNLAFARDFTPVLAKHSKSFSLIDCVSVGVDRMQRNFEPMRRQVEAWQKYDLTDVTAKVVIYEAFVEGKLEAPKHLARTVHDLYFEPKYEEFRPRTIWSLSNAFTSAFKQLDPIPQFKATAKLGGFLEARFSQSF